MATCTITNDMQIVPWLAADGPLAYSPEEPRDTDYYFQYGWVLPNILAEGTNRRRHYYFGAGRKDEARELISFWQAASDNAVQRVAYSPGSVDTELVRAPVAVYFTSTGWRERAYLFVQHGSYQFVRIEDQPLLPSNEVYLYRGVQKSSRFRLWRMGALDASKRKQWRRYMAVQAEVLSDATRSFNSIHDRTKRSETTHIRDRSWMTDEVARQHGLDIESHGFAKELWNITHQSFTMARHVAQYKFGPNYVTCKTPLHNIRLTTFFAGENEARIIDPERLEIIEAHGCCVEHYGR